MGIKGLSIVTAHERVLHPYGTSWKLLDIVVQIKFFTKITYERLLDLTKKILDAAKVDEGTFSKVRLSSKSEKEYGFYG